MKYADEAEERELKLAISGCIWELGIGVDSTTADDSTSSSTRSSPRLEDIRR